MNNAKEPPMVTISRFLTHTNEENIAKVYDFVIALQADKVVKSQTDDGYLTYVFIERKNG